MKKYLLIIALAIFTKNILAQSENFVVSTVLQAGSEIDDGLALDSKGNIYASFFGEVAPGTPGTHIKKITPNGLASVYVDGLERPNGIVFDKNDNLYVANARHQILKIDLNKNKTVYAQDVGQVAGLKFKDDSDTLYFTRFSKNVISRVYEGRTSAQNYAFYSKIVGPVGIDFDENGTMYIGNFNDGNIIKMISPFVGEVIATVPGGAGFITYANGRLYATAHARNKVYEIFPNGGISEIAGDGTVGTEDGPGNVARFNSPNGIIANATGDTIYVTEYNSKSLRRIVRIGVTDVEKTKELPNDFSLKQNYPNPFNPSTNIEFSVANTSRVELSIYNMLGEKVYEILNKEFGPGNYITTFDAQNLSSGTYIYSLKTNNRIITKKMTLLK